MKQVIQLERDDDLASIRSRFETTDFSQVVLVVPIDYPFLQNDPALQILRRAAQDNGVEVALVTRDNELVERSRDFGIPAFGAVGQARRDHWRMKPQTHSMLEPRWAGDGAASLSPEILARKKTGNPITADTLREWRLPMAMIALVIVVFFAAALFLVPAANVRIVPASIPLTLASDVVLDPGITAVNASTRSVPARRVSHEVNSSSSLRPTGTKNLPDARSAGTVIFQNRREEETVIPPNTVVKTSAGVPIRFTTTTTTTLPAGSTNRVEAPIQAVDPGPSGNVKELAINTIEGSAALVASVINLKPTQSGSVHAVRVVTAADKTRLEAQLNQQLKTLAVDALKPEIKGKEFIPTDSIVLDIGDEIFDRSVDDPADILNLKINSDAYALAVDADDLESLIRTLLQRQMQAGYQLLPGGIKVDSLANGKYDGAALRASLRATGYATPQIDIAKVSRALQGKSVEEATSYLNSQIQLAQPPTFIVTPPFWTRMPWTTFRIAVFIDPQGGQK